MGSALHLLLLSLCVGMIHGDVFTVSQPDRLEGVEGESIEIPCTFTYPDTLKPRGYDIAWRRNEFHGEFILNMSRGYTHPEYQGRIEFLGDPAKERTGTIRIKQLRTRDTNRYFCRVAITGNGYAVWQSVPGTYLTVRAQQPIPSKSTVKTTTVSTWQPTSSTTMVKTTGKLQKLPWIVAIACVVIVLIAIMVIAATIYCKKKRQQRGNIRKGSKDIGRGLNGSPVKDVGQSQEDPGAPCQPETAATGELAQPEGLVYASVQVGGGAGRKGLKNGSRTPRGGGDVVYAAVRFQPDSH